jgi:hypothetical protein
LPYGWPRARLVELSAMSGRWSIRRVLTPPVVFGAAASTALLAALLVGWLTGLRGVMHALLITLAAHALVPFVFILAVVAVLSAVSLATALIADEARAVSITPAAAMGGSRLARAYDAHIRSQRRHPLAWGAASGLGLGVVGIWLVLAALVVPLETRTLGILLLAQARLDAAEPGATSAAAAMGGEASPAAEPPPGARSGVALRGATTQRQPSAGGLLYPSAWGGASESAAPVSDAFGHAIAIGADAAGGAPYALRSLGLDGVPSADDLCVVGRTARVDRAHDPLAFLESLRDGQLAWSEQFAALARARCAISAQ